MNENLKGFLEEVRKNEELKAKLSALRDKDTAVEKTIEIVREYGFSLTAEDIQPTESAELSADDLDNVAGGVRLDGQRPYCMNCRCGFSPDWLMDTYGTAEKCPFCGSELIWANYPPYLSKTR